MEVIDGSAIDPAAWDVFCQKAAGAWFWHTWDWMHFQALLHPHRNSRAMPFMICSAGTIVAAVPLFAEIRPETGTLQFTVAGDGCLSPAVSTDLDERDRGRALRASMERVDEVANQLGVTLCRWRVSPLARDFETYLLSLLAATTRAGYTDQSLCSQVIDLTLSRTRLRSAMSKGHRAAVKRGRQRMVVDVLDHASLHHDDFAAYQHMHARAAGRVTRPTETFGLMEQWIRQGKAVLIRARLEGVDAGFAVLHICGDAAYYGSAANNPDLRREPVGQAIQSRAIEWLQEHGLRRYELGTQVFGELPYSSPSQKELAIAQFKRGFGGVLVPLVVRQKAFPAGSNA